LRVAGEFWNEAGDGLLGALTDCGGAFGLSRVEGSQTSAETGGVELRDGEDADAALGAAWTAEEHGAGAAGGIGNGGVDDLDEMHVAVREAHADRIVERCADENFVMRRTYAVTKQQ